MEEPGEEAQSCRVALLQCLTLNLLGIKSFIQVQPVHRVSEGLQPGGHKKAFSFSGSVKTHITCSLTSTWIPQRFADLFSFSLGAARYILDLHRFHHRHLLPTTSDSLAVSLMHL